MKTFVATYDWRGAWGRHTCYTTAVVSSTRETAIGLLLNQHKDTNADEWNLIEIERDVDYTD